MSAIRPKKYSVEHFPYAKILHELTNELQAKHSEPLEAYVRFQQLRRSANLLPGADYCSTSITSGGHARILGLTIQEKIARNTHNARQLALELVSKDTLHPRSMILPVDLGYIPGWGQSDYISFWLAVISGVDLGAKSNGRTAQEFNNKLMTALTETEVDLGLMNDHEAPAIKRAPEYFKFAKAWADLAKRHRPEPSSAHRVVNLIDPQDSLGCQTERLFAKLRGIPIYNIGVVGAKGSAAFNDKQLYRDLEMIVSYGGTTVEFLEDSAFILKSSAEKSGNTSPRPTVTTANL